MLVMEYSYGFTNVAFAIDSEMLNSKIKKGSTI